MARTRCANEWPRKTRSHRISRKRSRKFSNARLEIMNTLPSNSRLTVKIIGVGGAGGNVVQQLQSTDLAALPALIVHTNPRVLSDWPHAAKLQIGEGVTRGLGAGGDPDLGRQAAEEAR